MTCTVDLAGRCDESNCSRKHFQKHGGLVQLQGVKEAREKAEREEQVICRYEAQQAERLAAAEAEKRLRAARVRADIEQACLDAWQSRLTRQTWQSLSQCNRMHNAATFQLCRRENARTKGLRVCMCLVNLCSSCATV